MNAGLNRSEAATESLRRILAEQLASALAELDGRPLTDSQVHQARKHMKMARATLRLLRPALGSAYERENVTIRDAARPLSAVRDARVLLETLDRVARRHGAPAHAIGLKSYRRLLGEDLAGLRKAVLQSRAALQPQRTALRALMKRSGGWKLEAGGWEVPGAGLKRVYSRGREAMRKAGRGGTPEQFHAWRKQAKYLWHQLQLLECIEPGPVGELSDQLHRLADYLGEDHDLAVLRASVVAHGACFGSSAEQQALLALIDRRSAQLREKALILGRRVYPERPAEFGARFRRYWQDWAGSGSCSWA